MILQGWVHRLFSQPEATEELADLDQPDGQDVAIKRLQERQQRQEQRLRGIEASRDVLGRRHRE